MGWQAQKGRLYYYEKERIGDRVVSRYVDADPTAWLFPFVFSAVVLFEAGRAVFTFDELTDEGERSL